MISINTKDLYNFNYNILPSDLNYKKNIANMDLIYFLLITPTKREIFNNAALEKPFQSQITNPNLTILEAPLVAESIKESIEGYFNGVNSPFNFTNIIVTPTTEENKIFFDIKLDIAN
jgi:hypothetical protein